MSVKSRSKSNTTILLIIIATTFIPSFGSFALYKLAIVIALYCLMAGKPLSAPISRECKAGQHIILLWILSIVLASAIVITTEGSLNFATILHEFSRVIYYLCVIMLCFRINISLKKLFYACSVVILIHTFIQFTQYLSMGIFDNYIIQYYLQGETTNQHYLMSTMAESGEGFRSGSIFINPNVYVCYPYLSLGVFLEYYRREKDILALAMTAIAFVSVVLTGSRMGMISFLCIIGWFMWYSIRNKSIKRSNNGFIIILVALIAVFFFWNKITSMAQGMRAFNLDSAYEGSGSIKLMGLLGYMKISNPLEWIFGSLGADRLAIPIDMEWGYIFAWFGIVGLFWYIKLLRLVYKYHKPNFRIISTIASISIILTAMGASSVLNMSVFPYICVFSFSNILPAGQ